MNYLIAHFRTSTIESLIKCELLFKKEAIFNIKRVLT